MAPISNESIRDMTERVKNAFATSESTLRTIEEGKDPKKVIEENGQLLVDPEKSLVVSESLVTKGSVIEAINEKDDMLIENLVEADKNGETSTVPTRDFLDEIAVQPPKIEA